MIIKRIARLFVIATAFALLVPVAGAEEFQEGVDYELVTPVQNTSTGDKIEVLEIFWYGCPHCFDFEPFLADWRKAQPDDVQFLRMPAVFRQSWAVHARAYYALQALGQLESVHGRIFNALHVERKKLFDQASLAAFVGQHGVAEADFNQAYESMTVTGKTKDAAKMSRSYGITGVPAVIVNGKYQTSGRMAGSYERLLKVVDFLVAKER